MKPLSDVCPDPKKVIDLEPEKLGHHVLCCLSDTDEPNMKREDVAKTLASNYHPSVQHEVAEAVEKALAWLGEQCMLGALPYDKDLIYVTARGKQAAIDYLAEHPIEGS